MHIYVIIDWVVHYLQNITVDSIEHEDVFLIPGMQ